MPGPLLLVVIVTTVFALGGVGLFVKVGLSRRRRLRERHHADAAQTLEVLRAACATFQHGEYLTKSTCDQWIATYRDVILLAQRPIPGAGLLSIADQQLLRRCLDLLADPEAGRSQWNQHFVQSRVLQDQANLLNPDGRPLTSRQAQAIVTDEDATLVVAGAGTGKTSVIAGKVAYLLRHKLALPGEILVMAYGKAAAEELKQRIGIPEIHTSTFHSFGFSILRRRSGAQTRLSPLAEDDGTLSHFIKDTLQDLVRRDVLIHEIIDIFSADLDEPPLDPAQSTLSAAEWVAQEKMKSLTTLTNQRLKSRQEVKIANWLTLHGIRWEYERDYSITTETERYRQYRPDYYLPDYDLWIEHFGINCNHDTAPGIDRTKYLEGMAWKRQLHALHGSTLVETFSYDDYEGQLIPLLRARLEAHGVVVQPLTGEQIMPLLSRAERTFDTFLSTLQQFLSLYRGSGRSEQEVRTAAKTARDKTFLTIFFAVCHAYMQELEKKGEIDFDAMITLAKEIVDQPTYHSPYRYIIVDEFQDITWNRADLLVKLRAKVPGARLFAVGDDWQSIYRFAGSDLSIVTNLDRYAGFTARVDLDQAFRYPQSVLDVSAAFIQRNPHQLQKRLTSQVADSGEAPICVVSYEGAEQLGHVDALRLAMDDIAARKPDASVMLLGRYNYRGGRRRDFVTGLKKVITEYQTRYGMTITYKTAHAAKGEEADFVVIVELAGGEYGFPSQVADDPVMHMVLATEDDFAFPEERRLMYVAITRTRNRTYVMVPATNPSVFATQDLLAAPLSLAVEVIGEASTQFACPICGGKTINRRMGPYGAFWACMHWPICEGKLDTCRRCNDGAMVRLNEPGRHVPMTVFRCTACGHLEQPCPRCGLGVLRQRNGRNGPFLACSTWRADGSGCTHTQNAI